MPIPDDLITPPPDPPPADLLTTSYDLLHATGIDIGPYTRLFETFRELINGASIDGRPKPATFAVPLVAPVGLQCCDTVAHQDPRAVIHCRFIFRGGLNRRSERLRIHVRRVQRYSPQLVDSSGHLTD